MVNMVCLKNVPSAMVSGKQNSSETCVVKDEISFYFHMAPIIHLQAEFGQICNQKSHTKLNTHQKCVVTCGYVFAHL
jgi:hypothetical protein